GAQMEAPEVAEQGEPQIAVASQWKLIWWSFKRHKLAVVGAVVTLLLYLMVLFAGFLAPYSQSFYSPDHAYAPPQQLHFFDDGEFGLYVHPQTPDQDTDTYQITWTTDESAKTEMGLFVKGSEYTLFGIF